MSFHGYTFRFAPSADGRPERLYLVDSRAACPVCRNDELYRSFESTPFHSLTLGRLKMLPAMARRSYTRPCAVCGEQLGPQNVTEVVVTLGMAAGEGVIEARLHFDKLTFVVVSWRSFDPQALPRWTDAEIDESVLESIDEGELHSMLGRYLSTKQAVRDRLVTAGAERVAGRDIVITRHASPFAITSDPGVIARKLVASGTLAGGYPGSPTEWLSDLAVDCQGTTIVAWAGIDAAERAVVAVLGELPMPVRAFRSESGPVLVVAVPGAASFAECARLDLAGIATEAASTASEVADIARLEVERMLWFRSGIWGESFSDAAIERGELVVEPEGWREIPVVSTDEDHHHVDA